MLVDLQMIVNPRRAEAKDLSINNPLSQEVEVCQCYISVGVKHSGRTLVFDRRTFPVLRLTASWTDDHFVGQTSAVGQPTRPTQPFVLMRSINE